MRAGQPKGDADPGPPRSRARARTPASTQHAFHPPWPGITGPWCDYCSWAYRGRWPWGRMEVKFANAMCPKRAHTHHLVT